jgi:hypothetical protein
MRILSTVLIIIIMACSCSSSSKTSEETRKDSEVVVNTQVDHIMVGINNLDSGIAMLEEMTGVTAIYGGIHPGKDTRNALLSLGDGIYLELIAPQADLDTITNKFALQILDLNSPTPIHWAISTTDIQSTRSVVSEMGWDPDEVNSGGRDKPDGSSLSWRNFGISEGSDAASIPFFLEWGEGSAHPSTTSTKGCTFVKLIIHTSDSRISELAEALELRVEVVESEEDSLELVLDCDGNEVVL